MAALELLRQLIESQKENTKRAQKSVLGDFLLFSGVFPEQVTESHVYDYFDHLKGREGAKPRSGKVTSLSGRSIRQKMELLKALFEYLKNRRHIEFNPFVTAAIKLPNPRFNQKRPTEIVDFDKVLEICMAPSRYTKEGKRDRGILSVLFGAGLRKSEAIALTLKNVRIMIGKTDDEAIPYLELENTKGGEPQNAAMPVWCAQAISQLALTRKEDGAADEHPLFTRYQGSKHQATNEHLSIRTFDRIFKKWIKDAGISISITPHSARATAISKLFADKVDPKQIQEYGRHKSLNTTLEYDKRYFGLENSAGRKLGY